MPPIRNTIKIKVKQQDVLMPQFLYYAMLNAFNHGEFDQLRGGSVQQYIRADDLRRLQLHMGTPQKIKFGDLIATGIVEVGTELKDFDMELQRVGDNAGKPLLKNESTLKHLAAPNILQEAVQGQILLNYLAG